MSLFTKLGNEIASPVDAAGNPRAVENVDMQRWMTEVERATLAFQAGGGIIFPDKATMDGTLTYAANQMAWVMGDATAGNNGIYRKVGASGSGSWVRLGDLPFSFIMATNAGAGMPDAIVATSSLPVPAADGAALISVNIVSDNTTAPVTVAFNGGPALTIKTMSGNDVAPGGLKAGMIVTGFKSGSTFRLVTDQASAAIVAAAEAAQNAAEAAAQAAEDAVASVNLPLIGSGDAGKSLVVKQTEDGYELLDERSVVWVANRTALKSLDTSRIEAAFVTEAGRASPFLFRPENYASALAVDTGENAYVPPSSDPTGASGAWVRVNQFSGAPYFGSSAKYVNLADFGMSQYASAASNTAAFNAFMDFARSTDGCKGVFPVGAINVNTLIVDRNYVHLEGHKHGTWLINNTADAPIIYIRKTSGLTYGCSITNLRLGQSASVAVSGLNCGIRLENTFNTQLEGILCMPYPAGLRIGFLFMNSGESNFSNLWASGCINDGFRFSLGSPGGLCRGLSAHANGGNGFFFDGAGGHLVGLHAYNNMKSAFYFNDNVNNVPNRYFFGHSWIGDTSGEHNWYIKNLNCASFSDCWAATQNSTTLASACGVYIDGAKCYDIEFHGFKAKNNNAHGFYAGGGARNLKIIGGTFGSDPSDNHPNGKVNPGSGIALGLVTNSFVSLARCLGNSQNGLILQAQASDYNTIVNNNFRDNTGSGFVNNSTGANNLTTPNFT